MFNCKPQHAVEALWLTIKDLLEESNPTEVRQLALEFITALVSGQVFFLDSFAPCVPNGVVVMSLCLCSIPGLEC